MIILDVGVVYSVQEFVVNDNGKVWFWDKRISSIDAANHGSPGILNGSGSDWIRTNAWYMDCIGIEKPALLFTSAP